MNQNLHQQLVQLRGQVKAWLETGRAEGFSPSHGICGGIALSSSDRDHLFDLMTQWPGHSGYSNRPVPHPTRDPVTAFDLANPQGMWNPIHEYARNRWALLEWLIEQTASEAELNKHEEGHACDTRRLKCATCGSVGFEPSVVLHQCTFCDGTEGGSPPSTSGTVDTTAQVLASEAPTESEELK